MPLLTSLRSVFEWVDALPSSIAIRESANLYNVLLISHVLGMCLFGGLVLMMDLRLLGVGSRRAPFSRVQKRLFPGQMAGMALSFSTGLVLVYGQPTRFFDNVFFWVKTMMILLAGVNALAFHWNTYRSVAAWDSDAVMPFGARLAGGVSLVLWAGVVVCGRLIAYNWFNAT
jgi:uncharacterized protein DUF6644